MLYVLCGIQASGKTTLAKELESELGFVRHSFDDLDGANDPSKADDTFRIFCANIQADLLEGKDVICDAIMTNIERRAKLREALKDVDCAKYVIVLNTSFEECMRRNNLREEAKIEPVMMHIVHLTYQPPTLSEGWDEIFYVEV